MLKKSSHPQEGNAGPPSKWALVCSVVTLLGLTSATIYLMVAKIGLVGWLIDQQVQWFDGGYYPKITGGIVFIFLGAGLLIVFSVVECFFRTLWPKS